MNLKKKIRLKFCDAIAINPDYYDNNLETQFISNVPGTPQTSWQKFILIELESEKRFSFVVYHLYEARCPKNVMHIKHETFSLFLRIRVLLESIRENLEQKLSV